LAVCANCPIFTRTIFDYQRTLGLIVQSAYGIRVREPTLTKLRHSHFN